MTDPSPAQGSDTVLVDSHLASIPAAMTLHYQSGDRKRSGTINAQHHGELKFELGKPTFGFPIVADVVVGDASTGEKCQTKFYPGYAGGNE